MVRHYDQEWANGPKAEIKYWEIWNELDGDSLIFCAGTPKSSYRLYSTTARKLNELDSTLKVGGPTTIGNLSFLGGFLNYSQQHKAPVDFVSWHIYTQDAHGVARRARQVHELMVQYGYRECGECRRPAE